jgi:predicted RNA-binding protein with PIN domain
VHGVSEARRSEEEAASRSVPIEHRYLRSAVEFAVAIADAGQRLRPPIAYPAALKPFLKQPRIPAAALGKLRRAIEADDDFRARLAAGALPELVDPIGIEWLRREEGWEERLAELISAAREAEEHADAATALRRAERRREAAEQVAVRTRAELLQVQARVEELTKSVDAERRRADSAATEAASTRGELAEARAAVRHANDRAEGARRRLERAEAERDSESRRATAAEIQRDELLAERAERDGVRIPPGRIGELGELARTARTLADRLGGLVDLRPGRRQPLALPGGVRSGSPRATEFLLRAPTVLVLVDGYNVAKLAWPDEELIVQRERCLDAVDAVARRFGSEITVVFDGADVVGGHARKRRLARVAYSPTGVTADDVIRAEVTATAADRPVVVVTNDQAVRRDVAAAGANVLSSENFVAAAR